MLTCHGVSNYDNDSKYDSYVYDHPSIYDSCHDEQEDDENDFENVSIELTLVIVINITSTLPQTRLVMMFSDPTHLRLFSCRVAKFLC